MGVVEECVGEATGGEGRRTGFQIIEAVARRERPRVGLSVAVACVDERTDCFCEFGEEGECTANTVGCRGTAGSRGSMCVFERCGAGGGLSMERCLGRGRVPSRRKPCDRRCIADSDCLDVLLGKYSEVDETGGVSRSTSLSMSHVSRGSGGPPIWGSTFLSFPLFPNSLREMRPSPRWALLGLPGRLRKCIGSES